MTVQEAKKLFPNRELRRIENSIKKTSERDADLHISWLPECRDCGDNIFESIKQLIASGKTIGLVKITTGEASSDIIIQQLDNNAKENCLIFNENPQKEIKKLLLTYYPSLDDVFRNILKEAENDPESDMYDTHSYIRIMVDIYDENPETQTGEICLLCYACKKCNVE